MTHFHLLYRTNVAALIADLQKRPELWDEITDRKQGDSPHREAPDIWLRYKAYEKLISKDTLDGEHLPVWYPSADKLPSLKPLIFELMRRVDGEILGGVLITKVPAGKKVYPHQDLGWHVEFYDKFYIQLAGEEGCTFCCEDKDGKVERYTPKTGDVYLFDNRLKHWVDNESQTDRMTLIVCIRTQKFWRYK